MSSYTVSTHNASHHLTFPTTFSDDTPEDEQNFLEAKDSELLSSLAPAVAFFVLLAVVGVVGNSIVFLVYHKRFKASVTKTYIHTLSVLDLTTAVFYLALYTSLYRFQYTYHSVAACKLTYALLGFLPLYSGMILVAVALDRQKHICQQQARSPASVTKAKRSVLVCSAVSFVVSSPRPYLATTQTVPFVGSNVTGEMCVDLDDGQSTFALVYKVVFAMVISTGIIIMLVCYFSIAKFLQQHKTRGAVQSGRSQMDTTETAFTFDTVDTEQHNQQHVHTDVHTDNVSEGFINVHIDNPSDACTNAHIDNPSDACTNLHFVDPPEGSSNVHIDGPSDACTNIYIDNPSERCTNVHIDNSSDGCTNVHIDNPSNACTNVHIADPSDACTNVHIDNPSDGYANVHIDNPSDACTNVHTDGPSDVCTLNVHGNPSDVCTLKVHGNLSDVCTLNVHDNPSDVCTLNVPGNPSDVCTLNVPGNPSDVCTLNVHGNPSDVCTNVHTDASSDASTNVLGDPCDVYTTVHTDDSSDACTNFHTDDPSHACTRVLTENPSDDYTQVHSDVHTTHANVPHDSQADLSRPTQQQGSFPPCGGHPSRVTLMFFILTAVCIVSLVPHFIILFMRERSPLLQVEGLDPNVSHIMLRFYFLNCIINPFVYSFCSSKFRLECRRLFSFI